jgi:hypothetical protein
MTIPQQGANESPKTAAPANPAAAPQQNQGNPKPADNKPSEQQK